MKTQIKYFIAILSSCVFCVSSVIGQTAPEASFAGKGTVNLDGAAQDWELSEQDWTKYKKLMKGEAGLYYPHMPPSYVLTLYEDNPVIRQQHAEKVLDIYQRRKKQVSEMFRIQMLIATSRSEQMKEKAIDSERFDQASELFNLANIVDKQNALQSPVIPRRAFFVAVDDCDPCVEQAKKVITQGNVDIYFVGLKRTEETSQKIFKWAFQNGITQAHLDSGNITLKYDDAGVFAKLGGGDLPKIYNVPRGIQ